MALAATAARARPRRPRTPPPGRPTPAEAALPLTGTPFVFSARRFPSTLRPSTRATGELLLRWTSGFENELVAIAAAISNSEPPAVVTIVVSGSSADGGHQRALERRRESRPDRFSSSPRRTRSGCATTDRASSSKADLAIVDHVYNRPARPADDQIPDAVGTAWSLPVYDLSLVHGGGNFHLFADGEAFMTTTVLAENPGLSRQDVVTLFAAYENLDVTIWPGFQLRLDAAHRHVAAPGARPRRDRRQYPPAKHRPHQITEDAVTELTGRGYTVFRTPGWRASSTHYTYTNAVVFNHLVLIPQYNGYAAANAQALAVFAAAFPGKQLVPIDGSQLVTLAGVFHCIVMHVPDPDWIFEDDFETSDLSIWDGAAP
ncbi:MAG: agmatine deiminase family protein [Thermoanaerobaculia bacterium]